VSGDDPNLAVAPGESDGGPLSSELTRVSRAMITIYKEQFGRGPQRATSHYAGSDTLICLLYTSLSPVEHSMRAMGEDQRLRDIRMMFQYATEDRFRAAIEEITGRRVVAFMSGVDINHDVACEVFTLAPRPD
jgi:uncharacterized protein YbcI